MLWRLLTLVVLLVALAHVAFGGQLEEPPPLKPELRDVYLYFRDIRRHHNNLVITTTNPNGNIRATPGSLLLYNNASSYKLCVNVSTTGTGTLWRCSANALSAP